MRSTILLHLRRSFPHLLNWQSAIFGLLSGVLRLVSNFLNQQLIKSAIRNLKSEISNLCGLGVLVC